MRIAKQNRTRYAILGVLSRGPMTGYDIKKYFEEKIGMFWTENYAQIYPMLKLLMDEGQIESVPGVADARAGSKSYQLTESGLHELTSWLAIPADISPVRMEILLKLFNGQHLSVEENIKHIRRFAEFAEQMERKLLSLESDFKAVPKEDMGMLYMGLTRDLGIRIAKTYHEWCESSLKILEGYKETKPQNQE